MFPWTQVQVRGWEGTREPPGDQPRTDVKGWGGRGFSVLFDCYDL